MDQNRHIQEKLVRKSIEEERLARPVTYLSEFQKKVLKDISVGSYDSENSDGVSHDSNEAAALETLAALGLVHLISTKAGVGGRLTSKGRLLLFENPKLQFAPSEGKRWYITTFISCLALLVAAFAMVRTYL